MGKKDTLIWRQGYLQPLPVWSGHCFECVISRWNSKTFLGAFFPHGSDIQTLKFPKISPAIQPFPYGNLWECYKKLASRLWSLLYIYLFFSFPLVLENKKLLQLLFSSANWTTDYCSIIYITRLSHPCVTIGFNMINKHHKLPIAHIMLVKIC